MQRQRSIRRNNGFSLVELLVGMAISSLVLTAIYGLLITNSKSYSSLENTMGMTQDLRAATAMMIREIRMAGCDPTGAGGIGFLDDSDDDNDTDANSIRFTMDTDADGATTGTNEDINYYLYTADGIQKLGRNTGGSGGTPQPVAEYITALTFTYYDDAANTLSPGTSATDREKIYRVQVSISAETPRTDAITGAKKTQTVTTSVWVRNTGLE